MTLDNAVSEEKSNLNWTCQGAIAYLAGVVVKTTTLAKIHRSLWISFVDLYTLTRLLMRTNSQWSKSENAENLTTIFRALVLQITPTSKLIKINVNVNAKDRWIEVKIINHRLFNKPGLFFLRYLPSLIRRSSTTTKSSVDPDEINRFRQLSSAWWNETGEYAPLHSFNQLRIPFIREQLLQTSHSTRNAVKPLTGLHLVDIGCGGGILSEVRCLLRLRTIFVSIGDRFFSLWRDSVHQF